MIIIQSNFDKAKGGYGAGGTVAITFADLTITQSGDNVVITSSEFDSGDQVTINNILAANVTVDDLLFG